MTRLITCFAIAATAAAVGLATLFVLPYGASKYFVWPGIAIADAIWPSGFHSGEGLGIGSVWLLCGTIVVVNALAWTIGAQAILFLRDVFRR